VVEIAGADAVTAVAAAPAATWRPRNQVLPALVVVALVAALEAGFLIVAPNRLVSGVAVPLSRAADGPYVMALLAAAAALFALGFAPSRRATHYAAALIAGGMLLAALAAAGDGATRLMAGAPKAASIALGGGFWIIAGCMALALTDALRRAAAPGGAQLIAAALFTVAFVVLAKIGVFEALSLARAYAGRREVFAAAVLRHAELVAAAVVPAVIVGVPLGLAALRRQRFEAPLFAVLNLLQTVPSIALFGLLIVPLSALASALPALRELGIGGVGPAPAIVALILYALLPVARNTLAAIGGVPAAAVDAARGMGMTRRQVFWRIEVPLALPVLLAGLRIVTVQAIGLAVVAALIGAGGLGSFVFEGLGQYATDLVLLGALPAIAMALAVDFLLRLLAEALRRRYAP
jgi:osmoprotectant transport system permease protein